jgi:RhtB (resistance to homoserine/threonine) family protein
VFDDFRVLTGSTEDTNMLDQILVIVSITFLVMVSPGPDMILVLRNTLVSGRRAGLQTSMGILSGNLVHITYCLLGIGLLISQSILAFSAFKYVAAAYLIYLGIMSFRAGAGKLDTNAVQVLRPTGTWFVQGFVNNLLNPKGTLFYLGVFTIVITPETSAGATLVLIVIMMLVSASFWLFFVYTLDRRTIRQLIDRSQQTVNRIFGVLLVLLGVRVASMSR